MRFRVTYPKHKSVSDHNFIDDDNIWYVEAKDYSDATKKARMAGVPPLKIEALDVKKEKDDNKT